MTGLPRKQVVVVGAGPGGCAAAIEAAGHGLEVMLIDEHPQAAATMSLDTPYFYGARFAPVLANPRAVAERVLNANPGLLACLEAGVEVVTGTCVWGVFRPGPNSLHVAPQLGLADGEQSWCLGWEHLVLAPGARDLVLSFPGWTLSGVLGVKGASRLLESYQALEGERVLVLGSGNAGLAFATEALDRGIAIAGIVEPAADIQGDAALARSLAERGVPLLTGRTIERALGTQQVEGARLAGVAARAALTAGHEDIDCDSIVMAFGVVPNIELAAVAGCALAFDASHGGWVPVLGGDLETSVPGIWVVGDGAGVTEAMLADPTLAAEQGQRAARAIARKTGRAIAVEAEGRLVPATRSLFPPTTWLETLVAAGGMEVAVCQCEEVSRRELVGLEPPRYLEAAGRTPADAMRTAVAAGRLSQDFVKRVTRAGMGHCQGKRCRDHAAMLLARASGSALGDVVAGSYRVPVRPLSLAVLQAHDEAPEMRMRWAMWLHPTDGPPSRL